MTARESARDGKTRPVDWGDECPACGGEFPFLHGPHPTWVPCGVAVNIHDGLSGGFIGVAYVSQEDFDAAEAEDAADGYGSRVSSGETAGGSGERGNP